MESQDNQRDSHANLPVVRPVGTWVVGGFLIFVSLAIWILVAVLFTIRT